MGKLAGKTALVTGGSSGIGLAVARAFVQNGMHVTICGQDPEKLGRAAGELGKGVLARQCDVADADQVTALVDATVSRFGGLDVLVNNAGIGVFGNVAELAVDKWDRCFNVNVRGAFLCAKAAWPHLLTGGGHVFNIASVAGKEGFGGASAYSASKFALVGFSESLREEGIPCGIKVSVLCPGYVDTPMVAGVEVPPEEMIHPDDIAATCLYLMNLSAHAAVPEIVMRRMAL